MKNKKKERKKPSAIIVFHPDQYVRNSGVTIVLSWIPCEEWRGEWRSIYGGIMSCYTPWCDPRFVLLSR